MLANRMLSLFLALGGALPASAAAPAADHDLAWLAGAWCGGDAGERIEETWLGPQAGELIGMSRTVTGGRPVGYEFMRIAPGADAAPTFHAQPGGKPPTAFAATGAGPGWIRFANDHHDFPQWIEYRRDGERLLAAIGGPGGDGKQMRIDFNYARCKAAGG